MNMKMRMALAGVLALLCVPAYGTVVPISVDVAVDPMPGLSLGGDWTINQYALPGGGTSTTFFFYDSAGDHFYTTPTNIGIKNRTATTITFYGWGVFFRPNADMYICNYIFTVTKTPAGPTFRWKLSRYGTTPVPPGPTPFCDVTGPLTHVTMLAF